MPRNPPYGAFNFTVSLGAGAELGGFSDVSGLTTEIEISGYREGGQKEKPVRKIPGLHKATDITLKRGVVDSRQFSAWLKAARSRGVQVRRTLTIALKDEKGSPIQRWKVSGAWPQKWTGPTLSGKGNDVAIEELVLSSEGIEIE